MPDTYYLHSGNNLSDLASPLTAGASLGIRPGVIFLDNFTGTDDQKMTSALAAWVTAGGGTIQLAARAHTFASPWVTSYGGSSSTPSYLRIAGAGAAFNGMWGATSAGGLTSVTFTCTAVAACMQFMHLGTIEIDHVWLGNANTGVPLLLTTNASPNLHDNVFAGGGSGVSCTTDAVILGGTTATTGSGTTAAYQGYQGWVRNNLFDGIRRAVLWQVSANATDVSYNTVSATCGTNLYGGACFEFSAPTQNCQGNMLHHNCVETTYYYYGCRLTQNAFSNALGPNGFYDMGSLWIASYHVDAGCTGNQFYDGNETSGTSLLLEDISGAGTNNYMMGVAARGSNRNLEFGAAVMFKNSSGPPMSFGPGGEGVVAVSPNADQAYFIAANRSLGNTALPAVQVAYKASAKFTDGNITSGSRFIFSPTAAFAAADTALKIAGTGIPSQTYIANVYTTSTMQAWRASTAWTTGDMARPVTANGNLYQATTGGTTGSSAPVWPTTAGNTVTDGTVTWTCLGAGTAALMVAAATATNAALTFAISRRSTAQGTGILFEGQHIQGNLTAPPTVAVGGGSGSGATVSIAGSDIAFRVTLTTGTSAVAGTMFSVTFNQAYSSTPTGAILNPGNAAAAQILGSGQWYTTVTASVFSLTCVGTPPSSLASAVFTCIVIQLRRPDAIGPPRSPARGFFVSEEP